MHQQLSQKCFEVSHPVQDLLISALAYLLQELLAGDSPPEGKENGAPEEHSSTNGYPPPPGSDATPAAEQPLTHMARGLARSRTEGLAALLDSPDLPNGRAGPYALRRHLGLNKPISHREPSLAHLAATNSADLGTINHALTQARKQQTQSDSDSPKAAQTAQAPVQVAANSPKARAVAPAQPQQPFAGFAPSSSAGSHYAQSAAGAEPDGQRRLYSPFMQSAPSGKDPMDAFAHLPEGLRIQLQAPGAEDMSRTNSLVYNHVSVHANTFEPLYKADIVLSSVYVRSQFILQTKVALHRLTATACTLLCSCTCHVRESYLVTMCRVRSRVE